MLRSSWLLGYAGADCVRHHQSLYKTYYFHADACYQPSLTLMSRALFGTWIHTRLAFQTIFSSWATDGHTFSQVLAMVGRWTWQIADVLSGWARAGIPLARAGVRRRLGWTAEKRQRRRRGWWTCCKWILILIGLNVTRVNIVIAEILRLDVWLMTNFLTTVWSIHGKFIDGNI